MVDGVIGRDESRLLASLTRKVVQLNVIPRAAKAFRAMIYMTTSVSDLITPQPRGSFHSTLKSHRFVSLAP
jgi:hypothetical protein